MESCCCCAKLVASWSGKQRLCRAVVHHKTDKHSKCGNRKRAARSSLRNTPSEGSKENDLKDISPWTYVSRQVCLCARVLETRTYLPGYNTAGGLSHDWGRAYERSYFLVDFCPLHKTESRTSPQPRRGLARHHRLLTFVPTIAFGWSCCKAAQNCLAKLNKLLCFSSNSCSPAANCSCCVARSCCLEASVGWGQR